MKTESFFPIGGPHSRPGWFASLADLEIPQQPMSYIQKPVNLFFLVACSVHSWTGPGCLFSSDWFIFCRYLADWLFAKTPPRGLLEFVHDSKEHRQSEAVAQ